LPVPQSIEIGTPAFKRRTDISIIALIGAGIIRRYRYGWGYSSGEGLHCAVARHSELKPRRDCEQFT